MDATERPGADLPRVASPELPIEFTIGLNPKWLWLAFGLTYDPDETTGARVISVSPGRDFGGWGIRFKGKGRYGIITTKGPAAQITMAGGNILTITTERAEELAGAINTLADGR